MATMTARDEFTKNFINWCAKQKWNWLMFLQSAGTTKATAKYFRQWISEIEFADGTLGMRWIRFTVPARSDDPDGSFILVGGLSSDEWEFWAKRWQAITGDPRARVACGYRHGRRGKVKSMLEEVLVGRNFSAQLSVGPKQIVQSRTMTVDDQGTPTEKRMESIVRATVPGEGPRNSGSEKNHKERGLGPRG